MQESLIEIGYFQKVHGFKGQLKLSLSSDLIHPNKFPKFIWMNQYGKPVPFLVEEMKSLGDKHLIIDLQDVLSEQDAMKYKNELVYCEEEFFDNYFEAEENYDYLIGLEVYDQHLGFIGVVEDILENENSHANLVINYKNKEVLVPFVDEMILKIDEENARIDTNLPDGLMELYL